MDNPNLGNEGEPIEPPSKVVINGEEYTPEEAQELVGLGKKTREYEQKWNTQLDKVWPEYGRITQEHKATQEELAKAREQLATFSQKKDAGIETPNDTNKAREAARKLGITFNEDLEKSGYIKKDDLPKYFQQFTAEQKAVEKILGDADKYESEITGEDGRPAFNKKAVLAYMQAYQIEDPMQAYEDMYAKQIGAWKEQQVESKKNPSLKTIKEGGGKKEPKPVAVNDNNVMDLLSERLYGSKN